MEAPDGKRSPNLSFLPVEWTQMSKTSAIDKAVSAEIACRHFRGAHRAAPGRSSAQSRSTGFQLYLIWYQMWSNKFKKACRVKNPISIQIQIRSAAVTADNAAENYIAAFGANVAVLLVPDPLFGAEFPTVRDRPQNHFLSDGHRKLLDILARKVVALVTAGVPLFPDAGSGLALPTMQETIIGQTEGWAGNVSYI
jgi:hypothetical protein